MTFAAMKASLPAPLRRPEMQGYFGLLLLFAVTMGGLSLVWGYEESFLRLNSFRLSWLDSLMPHFTHLGEGAILTAILALAWVKEDKALVVSLALAMLGVLLLISPLKYGLFDDWGRPLAVLPESDFHYVDQVRWYHHAFPSGHSAAAAALFAFLAFRLGRLGWGIGIGLLACAVAFSRVYLGVHFPADLAAGVGIGGSLAALSLGLLYPRLQGYFQGISLPLQARWQTALQLAAGLTLAIALYELLRTYYLEDLLKADRALFFLINGAHHPWLDEVMYGLSYKWSWVPVYALLLVVIYRRWGWPRTLGILLGVALLITLADQTASGLLKPLVERFRPCRPEAGLEGVHLVRGKCGGAYGFVSSHAANFFALATYLSLLFRKKWLSLSFFSAAVLVAYSRVYLGVHYPGDVLGGALVGAFWGAVVFVGWKWVGKRVGKRV
jgi:undecaprenyl-diphosphatase